nr:hypothetical protein [Bacteroidota bacterium]
MHVPADTQPPPPPPGHGSMGNVPGDGAPIGSGITFLLLLGAAYGGKKVYDFSKGKPMVKKRKLVD